MMRSTPYMPAFPRKPGQWPIEIFPPTVAMDFFFSIKTIGSCQGFRGSQGIMTYFFKVKLGDATVFFFQGISVIMGILDLRRCHGFFFSKGGSQVDFFFS